MNRRFDQLAGREFDLVIIGGGINGAAIAWDAVLRGLSVVLLERADFGWATSSNSAKIAHSGMRYLQHADFKRMRESVRERNRLVANAPHLVDSMPFLMPVYGHGVKGRETVSIYLKLFDWLSLDRKQFDDPDRRIPDSEIGPPRRAIELMPGIAEQGLSAAALWQEGQMHNTERLLWAYVRAAAERGAEAVNYAEVTRIHFDGARTSHVSVVDRLTGRSIDIPAGHVVNATGPWALESLTAAGLGKSDYGIYLSKAFSLLTRRFTDGTAFTFPIEPMYRDKQALVDKGSSMQFAIPWRDSTMVASLHLACEDDPASVTITDAEIDTYIERINAGYPPARLSRADVRHILWGIIPAEDKDSAAPLKHYRIIDHRALDGVEGLTTVVGVKYTTSRDVAENTVDAVVRQLGKGARRSSSAGTPLWGGDIERIGDFAREKHAQHAARYGAEVVRRLVRNYGSGIDEVIALADAEAPLRTTLPGTRVLRAEVAFAVRHELALTLADVVLRRTDLGSLERPSDEAIAECADLMATELGWSSEVRAEMIRQLDEFYERRAERLGLAELPAPLRAGAAA